MAEPDFHATINRARAGDESAWARLYARHAPAVLGYLRAQRTPDADDLLAETWLHAVRDIDRFLGDERGFRSWLVGIARHRLLDAVRARRRRPDAEPTAPEELSDGLPASEAIDARLLAEQALLELLSGMSERQRSVLYLRFVLDMSQQETAQSLGMSITACKMLQLRAVRALRQRVAALDLRY